MSTIATNTGADFKLVPAAAHIARCIRVIDLGTHVNSFNGKEAHKIMLTFEVPYETMQDKEGKTMPMVISKDYTLSLFELSTLSKDLKSWRGKPFTPEELEGFDVKKVLGVPCQISVVHKPSKQGNRMFANVESIMGLAKGTAVVPPAMNELFAYDIEDGLGGNFPKLPPFVQKKILASKEIAQNPATAAQAAALSRSLGAQPTPVLDAEDDGDMTLTQAAPTEDIIPESDLPF